jgi:hypothetical protein
LPIRLAHATAETAKGGAYPDLSDPSKFGRSESVLCHG